MVLLDSESSASHSDPFRLQVVKADAVPQVPPRRLWAQEIHGGLKGAMSAHPVSLLSRPHRKRILGKK